MSGIEEVIESTRVPFSRSINLDKGKKLLKYIAANLPASISFRCEYQGSFSDHYEGKVLEYPGSIGLVATVIDKKGASDTFVSFRADYGPSLIAGIVFSSVPGWDLENYRIEVRQLWDDVRKVVNKYFEVHP